MIIVSDIYYIQTNLVCILVLLGIEIFYVGGRESYSDQSRVFGKILIITMLLCVSDIFAWTFNKTPGTGACVVLHLSNIVYYASITWLSYAWLQYVLIRTKFKKYNHKKRFSLITWPLIIIMVLLVTNPFTGFMFTINEYGVYSRCMGVILHWIVSWGYMLAATVIVIMSIDRSKSKVEKDALTPLIFFMVLPFIAALLQMVAYGLTAMQCGIVLSILLIVFFALKDKIMKDNLTGLNNRIAFNSFIDSNVEEEGTKLTIAMIDVDSFKKINDTQGHSEGDIVLCKVADALRRACAPFKPGLFLCRFGGDEFVIVGVRMDDFAKSRLRGGIYSCVSEVTDSQGNPGNITVSVGMADSRCFDYISVEELLVKADSAMYEEKKKKQIEDR